MLFTDQIIGQPLTKIRLIYREASKIHCMYLYGPFAIDCVVQDEQAWVDRFIS